ncbi:MAG: hypothetical protein Fur0024_0700 [Patescibacteria group bacterium]
MQIVLGIDFGSKSVGCAVSDIFGNTKPLATSSIEDFVDRNFLAFWNAYKFTKVVIGKITKPILLETFEDFLKKIRAQIFEIDEKIELIIFNEEYSTWDARFEKSQKKNRKKFDINAVSAEMILKNYLNNEQLKVKS